jgi:CII-binding regulator of phage lambda lysogenization HflD
MNEKGNRYALAALKDKRATLASEIVQLERQLRHRRDMLVHVDATLKFLDPSIDTEAIPNKRVPKRIMLFRAGELTRAVMDAMRQHDRPVALVEIVEALMKAKGLGPDSRAALFAKVRSTLAYQQRQGKVTKSGEQKGARWRLM